MLRIRPFPAVRPAPAAAARVASKPYDVVNAEEARALAAGNPDSFLHVVRSEIDLPPSTHPYADVVYEKAKDNFEGLIERGSLIRDEEPKLYLYRQVMNHTSQIGLVCCCHVDDYRNNIIKKHEKTRQAKEDDRTRHVLTINANSGPVFLTYKDQSTIDELVKRDTSGRPLYHFNAEDDVTHTVWAVEHAQPYVDAFAKLDVAYVADGHHRSASAARAGEQCAKANPNHTGDEEYNWFLTVLFPAGQLNILPYNRIVRDLNGKSAQDVWDECAKIGALRDADDPTPDRSGVFCLYMDGKWKRLEIDPATVKQNDPIESLDVTLLHDRLLGPVLGIGDPRTDDRVDFVGGIRGTKELERLVHSGDAALAVSMYPTSIEQLMNVSDANLIMPPKSTWFEPKLRSGLFVHELG